MTRGGRVSRGVRRRASGGGRSVPRQEVGDAQARGLARRSQGRPRGRMGARGGGADEGLRGRGGWGRARVGWMGARLAG